MPLNHPVPPVQPMGELVTPIGGIIHQSSNAVLQMVPIKELIKKYGSQRKLAVAMGEHQPQINRWVKAEALVCLETGSVYIKTKTTKPLLG